MKYMTRIIVFFTSTLLYSQDLELDRTNNAYHYVWEATVYKCGDFPTSGEKKSEMKNYLFISNIQYTYYYDTDNLSGAFYDQTQLQYGCSINGKISNGYKHLDEAENARRELMADWSRKGYTMKHVYWDGDNYKGNKSNGNYSQEGNSNRKQQKKEYTKEELEDEKVRADMRVAARKAKEKMEQEKRVYDAITAPGMMYGAFFQDDMIGLSVGYSSNEFGVTFSYGDNHLLFTSPKEDKNGNYQEKEVFSSELFWWIGGQQYFGILGGASSNSYTKKNDDISFIGLDSESDFDFHAGIILSPGGTIYGIIKYNIDSEDLAFAGYFSF